MGDEKNFDKKNAYEGNFLEQSGAGPASFVTYERVVDARRRLNDKTVSTKADWTLAYEDFDAASKAADRIGSDEFNSQLSAKVGVELSAPVATVFEEVEFEVAVEESDEHPSHDQEPDGASSELRIKGNRATIALGPQGDVRLTRIGEGELEINADVVMKELDLRKEQLSMVFVNGVPLDTYIRNKVMEAIVKHGGGDDKTE